ncbi:hypothetical protein ACFY1L_18315 [Streptomyces sp. NPDC001663]|uniref:hypothetical protein n=1 Tax=Streptomyces sp. NPDC001663 TaxID=3364597 RepID=UPI00367DCDB8
MRTRQARRAQERGRAAAVQDSHPGAEGGPRFGAAGSLAPTPDPEDERFRRLATRVRYVLLAIALVMTLWFMVALQDRRTAGLDLPVPTWALDVTALSPLLVLVRFWKPEIRKKGDTLEFDLRVFSGLYFLMAFLGAALGGYWQLWPGVAISAAVHVGIWSTNRRASGHG